jgi:ATP-dependent DNA helicase RecQ
VCLEAARGQSQRRQLVAEMAPPPIDAVLPVDAFRELCAAHPAALGEARQQARFLCGLSSPAQTGARLGRAALFGALADHPFGDVLAWCAAQAATEGGAPRPS